MQRPREGCSGQRDLRETERCREQDGPCLSARAHRPTCAACSMAPTCSAVQPGSVRVSAQLAVGTSPIHLDRQSAPLRMKNATRCSAHEFASARAVIVLPVPALPREPTRRRVMCTSYSRAAPTDHVCKVCRVCHGLCDIQYVWVSGAHRSAVVKETSHGAFAWRAAEEHAARWLDREARKYLGVHQRQHDHLLQHHRDGQVVDSEAQPLHKSKWARLRPWINRTRRGTVWQGSEPSAHAIARRAQRCCRT